MYSVSRRHAEVLSMPFKDRSFCASAPSLQATMHAVAGRLVHRLCQQQAG